MGWGSSPEADWKIIFSLFGVCIITFGIYSVYLFWNINTTNLAEVAPVTQISLSRETIQKIGSFYANKNATLNQLKTQRETSTDPEL